MKRLLDFIKDNNGVFYFDKAVGCFVLVKNMDVQLNSNIYCDFKGIDDSGEVPEKVGPEWVEPAILALERFSD